MTDIQDQIFQSFSSQTKLYSIISRPNTGKTFALVILSIIVCNQNPEGIKVL